MNIPTSMAVLGKLRRNDGGARSPPPCHTLDICRFTQKWFSKRIAKKEGKEKYSLSWARLMEMF